MTLIAFTLVVGMLLGAMLGVLGVLLCILIGDRVNKPKRKRKLTSYQVTQRGSNWIREDDRQAGILPDDIPLDTSWRGMSDEEQARLDAVIDFERWQMCGGLPK